MEKETLTTKKRFTSAEAAEYLGLSYDWFMRQVKNTELFKQHVTPIKRTAKARKVQYDKAELDAFDQASRKAYS